MLRDFQNPFDLEQIDDALARLRPLIRRTPLVPVAPDREVIDHLAPASLKLECLQVTGSFKARGAVLAALSLDDEQQQRGLITASGGNHGLGVAYAARALGIPATIVLPANAPVSKETGVRAYGADVIRHGDVWDDANDHALALAERSGAVYVHPFADLPVLLGQATIAREWLDDLDHADVLVVPIGGGGLIGGVAVAAKLIRPSLRIVGVEPTGAPTMLRSVEAGRVVTLDRVETRANTLAPRQSAAINLAIVEALVDDIVLVDDDAMHDAARWLWSRLGIAAELSGAAATAAVRGGHVGPGVATAIVCGRGTAAFDA